MQTLTPLQSEMFERLRQQPHTYSPLELVRELAQERAESDRWEAEEALRILLTREGVDLDENMRLFVADEREKEVA